MSITDELRKYTKYYSVAGSKKDTMLSFIADCIDAEHERQLEVLYRDMSDAEYVKLPVDMDGEPIHVGDWMTPNGMDMNFKVRQMHFNGAWSLDLDGFGISETCPDMCRHYHAPTVEDVLREMADRCYADEDEPRDRDAIVAEYAAKLRLREDA